MSDPNNSCENHMKRKFKELPDEVTITEHHNKRYDGLRSEFMTIGAEDIAMPATSELHVNLLAPK